MRLTIDRIVLWPRDQRLRRRVVDIAVSGETDGNVCVIRGTNQTGKSALLSVIDYCLGSQTPTIPNDAVFGCVSWYGLVLRLVGRRVVIARGAPSRRGPSEECYGEDAGDGDAPISPPTANLTPAGYAEFLDSLVGLLDFRQGSDDEQAGSPRSLLYQLTPFLLAPSDYLARRSGLMQQRTVSVESAKRMVPIALRATTAQGVQLEETLRKSRRERKRSLDAVRSQGTALSAVEAAARREFDRAVSFGLVVGRQDDDLEGRLDELTTLSSRFGGGAAPDPNPADAWQATLQQIQELQSREAATQRERTKVRAQLRQLGDAVNAAQALGSEIENASTRVGLLDWLAAHVAQPSECPLCGSGTGLARVELDRITGSVWSAYSDAREVYSASVDYREQLAVAEARLASIEGELENIRQMHLSLSSSAGIAGGDSPTLYDISRLVGVLEPIVASRTQLEMLASDRRRLEVLDAGIAAIESTVAELNVPAAFDDLEAQVLEHVRYYADIMELGHATAELDFSLSTMDFGIRQPIGDGHRRLRLDQVGSAKNWMGYKLALHLALHELFYLFAKSPVPSFLVLDHISQVDSSSLQQADGRSLTFHAFQALVHASRVCGLQVLVLEGMQDESFLAIDGVHTVEVWPDDSDLGLIPIEWLAG